MTCLINFLLQVFQYYSIFYGFNYIYIDFENNIVKFSKYIKVYVYLSNCIFIAPLIYTFKETLSATIDYPEEDIFFESFYIISYFTQMCIFGKQIFLRLEEEKTFKKWHQELLPYEKSFFSKVPNISADRTLEGFKVLNIFIILVHGLYSTYIIIRCVSYKQWFLLMDEFSILFLSAMENYIMFHHILILCYINNCFIQLNNQLKHEDIQESFAHIFYRLSLLLQQVNHLKGPIICSVLFSQLVKISLNGLLILQFILFEQLYAKLDILIDNIVLTLNIFLYFLICDRVHRTTRETSRFLMEYTTRKSNREVKLKDLKRIFNISISIIYR